MAKYPEELEILEETYMYWKIEWKGLNAPAKFNITYKTGGDCFIYASYKHSLPNKTNWDSIFKKPKRFLLLPEDKGKIFNNDFIYLWLHSIHGISLQLLVDFPEGNEDIMISKAKQSDKEAELKKLNIALLKFCNLEEDSSPTQDIVNENKRRVFFWPNIKCKELEFRKTCFLERSKQCQIRK